MPGHPDVKTAIAALRAVAPAMVAMLETAHPHLLVALLSKRITDEDREAAMQLIKAGDFVGAKRHLGVMLWVEANFDAVAMGLGFMSRATNADFDIAMEAVLPARMDAVEQARCLLNVTNALNCSTPKAGLILADAHRQAYDIAPNLIGTIGFVLWSAEHPRTPLAGMLRGSVQFGSKFGQVVADTLGVCQFMIGYLLHGREGPRPVLLPHRDRAFDVTQVCQPSEACDLAHELGPEHGPAAYDLCAAGHLGRGMWTVVVRDLQGAAIGVARLDEWGQTQRIGRFVARGGIEGESIVRAGATETIRLAMARGGPVRFAAAPRYPPFDVLETRWDELTGPYRGAHPHVTSGPIQAFDTATLDRLFGLVELMSGMASRV